MTILGLALILGACGDDSDGNTESPAGMKSGGESTAGQSSAGAAAGMAAGTVVAGQPVSAGTATSAGMMMAQAGEDMTAGQGISAGMMNGGSSAGMAAAGSPSEAGANGTTGGTDDAPVGPMCGAGNERCRVACSWIAQCAETAMMCQASVNDLSDACTASCVAMPMAADFLCGVTSCDDGLDLVMNTQADFVATCSGPVGGQVVGGMVAGGAMAGGAMGGMDGPATAYTTPEVQALLSRVCAPCHTENGQTPVLNVVEDTFWIQSNQVNLPFIHPGNRARSYLYHKVAGSHLQAGGGGSIMPPNFP